MKSLFLMIAFVVTSTSYAQTDEFNLKKYWKFRNTFVEQFVKIGDQPGEYPNFPFGCLDAPYRLQQENANRVIVLTTCISTLRGG